MQLFMFLVLSKVFLPQKINDYILANDMFNFNLGIPGLDSIPVLKDFLDIFIIEHSDETLHGLSVESLSTFYNLFSHLVIFLLVVVIHLIFWLIKSQCPKRKSENCFVRLVYWIATKIWNLLTFTLYIRTIIQISQFWMISSISELYNANMISISTTFSFAFACVTLIVVFGFTSLNVLLGLNTSDTSKSEFKEYFSGVKNTRVARMYNVVIMIRRVVLVSLMVCLSNIDKVFLVLLAVCYQIAHTAFIIWMRPYASIKDNINETMIDIVFSVLLITLLYFHTEEAWNEIATDAYFYLLNFPGMFIFLSSLGKCFQ